MPSRKRKPAVACTPDARFILPLPERRTSVPGPNARDSSRQNVPLSLATTREQLRHVTPDGMVIVPFVTQSAPVDSLEVMSVMPPGPSMR